MTSAEGTSWARHFGATENLRTGQQVRSVGVDNKVNRSVRLCADGANVLPTAALEEGLLHEHSQARQSSSIVRSGAWAASNSASIRTQKVLCQQTLRAPVKLEMDNLHGHTARHTVAPHSRPDAGHAIKGSSPVQHSKGQDMEQRRLHEAHKMWRSWLALLEHERKNRSVARMAVEGAGTRTLLFV